MSGPIADLRRTYIFIFFDQILGFVQLSAVYQGQNRKSPVRAISWLSTGLCRVRAVLGTLSCGLTQVLFQLVVQPLFSKGKAGAPLANRASSNVVQYVVDSSLAAGT